MFCSCSENEHEQNVYLEEVEDLVLDYNKNEIIFKLKSNYSLNSVCEDITPDSVIIYDYNHKNKIDTINGNWFQAIKDEKQLYINVKENNTNDARQFRILYSILPSLAALRVIQKGIESK